MNSQPISARQLCRDLGYVQWRNFDSLIGRAVQLVRSGESIAKITLISIPVPIGSNAIRHIPDYELDEVAAELVTQLAAAKKLHRRGVQIRNETVMLSLLAKYFTGHGVSFSFQVANGGFVFDALAGDRVLVEFDEPHHSNDPRDIGNDIAKNYWAVSHGYCLVRLTLDLDIIDMILSIERRLPS